jgi:hypothetical protein
LLILDDLSDAADVRDGNRFGPEILLLAGTRLDDGHELVTVESVLGHLTVSGLEDMEWEDNMGK